MRRGNAVLDRPRRGVVVVAWRGLGQYLDRGPLQDNPLLQVLWLLDRLRKDVEPSDRLEQRLAGYVLDQFDLRELDAQSAHEFSQHLGVAVGQLAQIEAIPRRRVGMASTATVAAARSPYFLSRSGW